MHKLGVILEERENAFSYPDIWAVEQTSGPNRLVIAPSSDHVGLLLELARTWKGEYGLVYVLLASRVGNNTGRYEAPEPLQQADLEGFLTRHGGFLESDGRHHLWITSAQDEGRLVYDQHNVIYAYGNLARYREIVEGRGLTQSAVRFPSPHTHSFHDENNAAERELLRHWDWRQQPLYDRDEY